MGRQEWINNMIYFQALCRGYLMRGELKCVQAEYEDIVRELEGGVEHLSWRGQFIPKPQFTDAVKDTDSAFFRYPQPKIRIQECPEDVEKEKERVGDETPCLQSELLVPERDAEPSCGTERDCRETRAPSGGDTDREGDAAEGTLRMSDSMLQHGESPPMHTLLKGVAHTPEGLKQHRNTLAMELLWIQQAIASRKKYLTLKQKMESS